MRSQPWRKKGEGKKKNGLTRLTHLDHIHDSSCEFNKLILIISMIRVDHIHVKLIYKYLNIKKYYIVIPLKHDHVFTDYPNYFWIY